MSYLLYAHFFVQKNVEVNMLLRAYPNIYYRTSIPPVLRVEYIEALRVSQRANQPDAEPFITLIAEYTIETQKDYCRLLRIKANKKTSACYFKLSTHILTILTNQIGWLE